MVRKSILVLATVLSVAGTAKAQSLGCATDEMNRRAMEAHPEIAQYKAQMDAQIREGLKHIDMSKYAAKGTGILHTGIIATIPPEDKSLDIYHIPIVVHVIHDYGTEYLKDDDIYQAVKDWNIVYMKENADTADVIAPYKYYDTNRRGYIGNPRIVLHLANRDQYGNPSKGIVHHQSYLTSNGSDQAKYDQWPNSSYLNIWFIRTMSAANQMAAAYAYFPSTAQAPSQAPYDGVIALSSYMNTDKTINHEIGHCMSLYHPWGNNNSAGVACGDDEVDDTPPTTGHNITGCTAAALYDTSCSSGYTKNYLDTDNVHVITVDYPDTSNSQNIMDYTYCSKMFTKGQVLRMHQALNLDVANRSHLWSQLNLVAAGIIADSTQDPDVNSIPTQDLPPIPDFSVEKGKQSSGIPPSERTFFYCANDASVQFSFINRSWNDTITQVKWHFSNGATIPDVTSSGATLSTAVTNSFSEPGWVSVSMDVSGNGGTSAQRTTQPVYAADGEHPIVVDPNTSQYTMDFNPGQTDNWPIFNYYNNEFKWQLNNNVGFLDNTCIQYTGYDARVFLATPGSYPTGSPGGDYDDFFTPAFDLTAMTTGNAFLNFMSAGTFRTGNPADMKDSLVISYSTNCGRSWTLLKTLSKHELANNGTLTIAYAPLSWSEWALQSISLPAGARTNKTFFRFRYTPGVDANQNSTGNNFFLDRINIGNFPAGLNTLVTDDHNIAVAPNPTTGNSYVVIKGINKGTANVQVTDVTGRVIFSTSQTLSNNLERVEIPASVLQVKGMYMVHVKTDKQNYTEKLVSY